MWYETLGDESQKPRPGLSEIRTEVGNSVGVRDQGSGGSVYPGEFGGLKAYTGRNPDLKEREGRDGSFANESETLR